MESRFFFLFIAAVLLSTSGCSLFGGQQSTDASDDAARDDGATPVIIDPDLDRRDIKQAKIDRENFEVSAYAGLMSIEDFGTGATFGGRLAFHISEDFFVEAAYGFSEGEKTSFELLSGSVELLTAEQREFTYYNMSLGYNIFPGEIFIGRRRAFNSNFYVIGGVGSTEFAGDDRFTANVGAGLRVVATDAFALRLDVRDHLFDIDLLGSAKTAHNIEYHIGLSFFF